MGLAVERQLHGGHQSRVLVVRHRVGPNDAGLLVAKCTDRRFVDPVRFRAKVDLLLALAERHRPVVGPISVSGKLVNEVGGWLVVGFPLIDGSPPLLSGRW